MSEQLENFSPSCERNKQVILAELQPLLAQCFEVLEIGSFSGQHALHFSEKLPQLFWHTSDVASNLNALNHNLSYFAPDNCRLPFELDVSQKSQWPEQYFDAIYTANTLHIMSWENVQQLFANIRQVTKQGTLFVVYGPFNYDGKFTSNSNADFEQWLKARDINSGIRDFEQVNELAKQVGFELKHDIGMPANNRLLVWQQTQA